MSCDLPNNLKTTAQLGAGLGVVSLIGLSVTAVGTLGVGLIPIMSIVPFVLIFVIMLVAIPLLVMAKNHNKCKKDEKIEKHLMMFQNILIASALLFWVPFLNGGLMLALIGYMTHISMQVLKM
jgi:hypothetical protein